MLFASAVFVHPSKLRGTQSSGTEFLSASQSLPLRPASLGVKGDEAARLTRLAQAPGRTGQRQPRASPARAGRRAEAAAGLTCPGWAQGRQLALAPGAIPVSLNEQV